MRTARTRQAPGGGREGAEKAHAGKAAPGGTMPQDMQAAPSTRGVPAESTYFKIGVVCEMTDTQPYVLRFWESEFPQLAPRKSRAGQRIYTQADVDTILRIKKLLYEEEFTIAGARKRLEEEAGEASGPEVRAALPEAPAPPPPAPQERSRSTASRRGGARSREAIRSIRQGLREIRDLLRRR